MNIKQFCLGWIQDINLPGSILGIAGMVAAIISVNTSYEVLKVPVAIGVMFAGLQIGYSLKIQGKQAKDTKIAFLEMAAGNALLTLLAFVSLTAILFIFAYFSSLELGIVITALIYFASLVGVIVLFTASLPYTASRATERTGISLQRYKEHLRNSFQQRAFLKMVLACITVYLLCPVTWYIFWTYNSGMSTSAYVILASLVPPAFCLAWGSVKIASNCLQRYHSIPK